MNIFKLFAILIPLFASAAWAETPIAKIAFVGDVMLAETEGTGRFVAAGGNPFGQVTPILSKADLRVANFESSAGTQGQADPRKPYSFRTSQAALATFASVFEVAGLANNHAGDYGRADFVETLQALKKLGVKPFGGGRNLAEAHQAAVLDIKGIKIALLGYLDFFPRWFSAAPDQAGVAWLDEDQVAWDISQAKAKGADLVVVLPHWGVENDLVANQRQRRLAKSMIDAGADAVLGGHPHVVQDHEVYKGKPIVYSLGNFVFDGFEDDDNLTGWILFADFDRTGVASLTTQVVKIDEVGSPAPRSDQSAPCWRRGDAKMSPCPSSRQR